MYVCMNVFRSASQLLYSFFVWALRNTLFGTDQLMSLVRTTAIPVTIIRGFRNYMWRFCFV